MKRKILVDTSYLFALNYEQDSCFQQALTIQKLLMKDYSDSIFYLGMHVYSEILTLVRQRLGKPIALTLLERINDAYELINPIDETYIKADNYFRRVDSKNISYADCISFAIMKQEDIELVLSFNEHFKQMGFKRVGIEG